MLVGLDDPALGPLRKVAINHPPTREWVEHGCIECGTTTSFTWRYIAYKDTNAPVCGSCYGLTFEHVWGEQ